MNVKYNHLYGSPEDYYEYCVLVGKIRKINREIAIKMCSPNDEDFPFFSYIGDLKSCFVWDNTKEGGDFWEALNRKLEVPEEDEKEVPFTKVKSETLIVELPEFVAQWPGVERMEYIYHSGFLTDYNEKGWKLLSIQHRENAVTFYRVLNTN